jgi:aspartate/methionine/tyrosine aminotransferase
MNSISRSFLSQYAYNLRWAELPADIIPLTAADWDIPFDEHIRLRINQFLLNGGVPYGNSTGIPEFKEALANYYESDKAATIDADQIIATNSAAKAIEDIYEFLLQPGDEILVANPVDFLLAECANRMNVRTLRYSQTAQGISIDELNQLLTAKTKALVLCNPHNPKGYLLSDGNLQQLVQWAEDKQLHLIVDEVWSDVMNKGKKFKSIFHFTQHAWVIYGFSKGFGLAGMRLGSIIAPNSHEAKALADERGYYRTIEGASVLSQIAGLAALEWSVKYSKICHQLFESNIKHAVTELNQIDGLHAELPDATFVVSILHNPNWNTEELCGRLKEEARVAVVPGLEMWFGSGANHSFRLSLATSEEICREAISRITSWFKNYGSTL